MPKCDFSKVAKHKVPSQRFDRVLNLPLPVDKKL